MFDGPGFGGAFMWLFGILLIVVIASVSKPAAFSSGMAGGADKSSSEILKDHSARGEIFLAENLVEKSDAGRDGISA